ncbi:MAG: metal ABC transporter substrate-binding protein [Thermodesulfovibrionales bacterium]|nr:metal ABC transporter substrate-binding protein [Thermodesulfovibrionales bacterium]
MKNIFGRLILTLFLFIPINLGAEELNILVSIYPLEDITKNIGRQRVTVRTLIPAGANPHAFEPAPSEIRELTKTRLFIKIGAGLEFWAERFVRSAKKDIRILDLSKNIPLLEAVEEGHGHSHEGDPHYWLDPVLVKSMVDSITATLISLDPGWRDFYIENATEYKKRLDDLHKEIKKRISQLPKKEFVALHPAWNYFSKRYGLNPIYIIEGAGRELRPGNIKRIIDFMREKKTKAIFGEPQFSTHLVEALARESGAMILMLDPIGGRDIPGRDSYINLMLYNLSMFEKALR